MAVTFGDVQTICQEAFYILRQDASVLTEANWLAGTPIEVAKCRLAVETAANEVIDAFEWRNTLTIANIATWPAKVRNACVYCLCRELAIPIAGRIEDMKNYDALYRDKLLQAKLTELNKLLATNDDPVLAEVLGGFRSDDAGLVSTFEIYTRRASVIKETATSEVNAAHDWLTPFVAGDTAHAAYPAWVDLCCAKMAASCGLDANFASLYEKRYLTRLAAARAADLESAKSTVKDQDVKEVFALSMFTFNANDARLPRNIGSIVESISTLKDSARKEVLTSHDWNFAKVVERCVDIVDDNGTPYRHTAELPNRALRLIAAYGCGGDLVEWKLERKTIRARDRIYVIKFIRDVADFSKWNASAYRAYLLRLSADVARSVMNNAQDAQLLEAKYSSMIADAKLRDTREGNTPTDAWGPNHYVEMMHGSRRHHCEE